MDFGNVPSAEGLRLELPPLDRRSLDWLARARSPQKRKVYVGGPVWSVKEWVGKVYPPKTPAKDFLRIYARQFNAIELNSTFYKIPERKTLQAWRETVPAEFRFSPKIPQALSRSLGSATRASAGGACKELEELEDRLGLSFLQLPPSFSPKQLGTLERFLGFLPKGFRLAVELRHGEWFEGGALRSEAFELLRSHGAAVVITDTAGRRDVLHASVTASAVFVRFLGNELHASDYTRLDDWVARLKRWLAAGVTEVYFYMHHGTYERVPELVSYFIEKANASWGSKLKSWEPASGAQLELKG